MDNNTVTAAALVAAVIVTAIAGEAIKTALLGCGTFALVDGRRVVLNVHSSRWAAGDKAHRIAALRDIADMFGGSVETNYRTTWFEAPLPTEQSEIADLYTCIENAIG